MVWLVCLSFMNIIARELTPRIVVMVFGVWSKVVALRAPLFIQ